MQRRQRPFSPAVVKQAISGLSDEEIHRLVKDWRLWARSSQLPPEGVWRVWLLMAGRGFGKTRTGAEWVRHLARQHAGCYIGLVGASFDDVRHVMIEGPSGILSVCSEEERPLYLSSKHQLQWQNGTIARAFAADTPSQLRGPEFHFAWADEIAKWRYQAAWDNLMLALRAGDSPRILATTTPRPLDWLMTLAKAPTTKLVTGKTDENQSNLAPDFVRAMYDTYGQSDLARQELGGLSAGITYTDAGTDSKADSTEYGVSYKTVVGGNSLKLTASIASVDAGADDEKIDTSSYGATYTSGDFGLRVAVNNYEQDTTDRDSLGFGLTYTASKDLKFGLYSASGEEDTAGTKTDFDELGASLTYTIAPGLTTNFAYTDYEEGDGSGSNVDVYLKVAF